MTDIRQGEVLIKARLSNLLDRAGQYMLQRRWLVMALISLVTGAALFAIHQPSSRHNLDPDFLLEVLVFSLILPLMGGLVLTRLAQLEWEETRKRLRWRWLVMIVGALIIIGAETAVHLLDASASNDADLFPEILAFGIALPLIGGGIITQVASTQSNSSLLAQKEAAVQAERLRIARDLHDSLAQSLGYLHLKLDQLAGDDALDKLVIIKQEMEHMRDLANTAYGQVRGTLADLCSAGSTDLATTLLDHARTMGSRADFEVQLASEGQPFPLSAPVQREILYLFREALNNVAKHASAKRVDIKLVWSAGSLTISFSDNGRGFELGAVSHNGHLGLWIMQECARALNGRLDLASRPGEGTQFTLWFPFDDTATGFPILKAPEGHAEPQDGPDKARVRPLHQRLAAVASAIGNLIWVIVG